MILAWTLVLALQSKAPVPDATAQKDVEKLLREVFKDDYAKKAPADRTAFAKKLLAQGTGNTDNPSARYCTLREAMDIAMSAGDPATAVQAAEELGKSFEVDAVKLKFAALTGVVKDARPADIQKTAATLFLALVDEAVAREDPDTAEKAAAAAVAAARKAKDVPLAARAEAKAKEGAGLKQRMVKLKAARDALKANPDDSAANGEVGRHLCFVQGDWAAGLPHLAKGAPENFRSAALKDLAAPEGHAEQIAVADEWREIAEKETGALREKVRGRAAFWYGKAQGAATGLARVKIEKRLAEMGAPVVASPMKSDVSSDGLVAWWKLDEGVGNSAADSSGRKHAATLSGAEWAEGKFGKAIRMSGRGELVSTPDAPDLRLVGDITIALWFRRDGQSSDWVRFVGKGGTQPRNYGLWVGSGNRADELLFQQWDAAGQPVVQLSGVTRASFGTWTHLGAVVNGSQATLYVNGRKDATGSRSGVPATTSDPVTIGYAGYHQALVGAIDDVRIYNRALTDAEIEKLAAPK